MALLLSGLGQGNGGAGSHWFGAEVLSPVWTHSVRDASEKSEAQHLVDRPQGREVRSFSVEAMGRTIRIVEFQ